LPLARISPRRSIGVPLIQPKFCPVREHDQLGRILCRRELDLASLQLLNRRASIDRVAIIERNAQRESPERGQTRSEDHPKTPGSWFTEGSDCEGIVE
jgi:hypothetical protein